jgi:Tfp pilus assembly protein FimT
MTKMAEVELTVFMGILAILSVLAYIFILRRMKTKQLKQADTASHTEPTNAEVNSGYSEVQKNPRTEETT